VPMIKASTSERGCCPDCGAPWARVVKVKHYGNYRNRDRANDSSKGNKSDHQFDKELEPSQTLGWMPTCDCYPKPDNPAKWKEHNDAQPTVPAVVLDPFGGSGTVGVVAKKLGRDYILIEIKPEYAEMGQRRLDELGRLI